ncbi:MAG: methyltransferase [Proteobacteria bacterium]|nr:methyltransferase [Pseudomonadota bacterium]
MAHAPSHDSLYQDSIHIYALSASGQGIGKKHTDTLEEGKICFVRGAVPGDEVMIRTYKQTSSYDQGVIKDFVKKSPYRKASAKCAVFLRCGGCAWMDIPYTQQLLWKQDMVRQALAKHCAQMSWFKDLSFDITPSDKHYGYRSRWKLRCRFDDHGRLSYGFFAPASHDLVAIKTCPISSKSFHDLLALLNNFHHPDLKGIRCILDIQEFPLQACSSPNMLSLAITVCAITPKGADISCFTRKLKEHVLELNFALKKGQEGIKENKPWLWDQAYNTNFYGTGGGFLQSNRDSNRKLRDYLYRKALCLSPRSVLDIYCGMGNLSLALYGHVKSISGVEASADALRALEASKQALGSDALTSMEYRRGQACKDMKRRLKQQERYDLVILNPPRSGAKEVLSELTQIALGDIYYVSCYPLTLSSDIFELTSYGFSVMECRLFDFYPHTPHVEIFVHLSRH